MLRTLLIGWLMSAACANALPPRSTTLEHAVPAAAAQPVAAALSTGAPITVATFNTYGMSVDELRRELETSPALRDADLIALQEVERHADELLSRACMAAAPLELHCVYAPGHRLRDGGDLGVALLSRTPISEAEVVELPYISTVVRSGRRISMLATAQVGDLPVRVAVVHLDNRISPSQRRRQMQPVFDALRDESRPTLIAGDFNTSPFDFIGHLIPVPTGRQQQALERQVVDEGYDLATRGSGPTSKWLSMRLDAIYTRGLTAVGVHVDRRSRGSDHLPLSATLTR